MPYDVLSAAQFRLQEVEMQHYQFDVAVSFASEDREIAEPVIQHLTDEGYEVFYDLWQADILLGKNLLKHLEFVYRKAARYCIIFISADYARKTWTTFELRTALKRAVEETYEYILPLRVDDTPLLDLHPDIAYVDLRSNSVEQVVSILHNKLGRPLGRMSVSEDLNSADKQRRLSAMTRIWCEKDSSFLEEMKVLLCCDPNSEIRARAAWVLDSLGDISARDALLAALEDSSRNVRSNAAWALVHLGSDVREDVMRVLRHSNSEDAREAATLILQTSKSKTLDPQIWDELAAMYGTEGAAARVAAEAMVFASAVSVKPSNPEVREEA